MIACAFCGKRTLIGMDTTHRHSGAWALRGPKSRKLWKPNLKYLRIDIGGGMKKRLRLCVACIKQFKKTKTAGIQVSTALSTQGTLPATV